jgi:hypothetical protein
MTINSPRLSTMAPPSGGDGPFPSFFSVDAEADRWRPRVIPVSTTTPPPFTTTQLKMDKFEELKEFFSMAMGEDYDKKEIIQMAI